MSQPDGPFADSRTVQESNGGYTISIPKTIAERYGIQKGDEVYWMDEPTADQPQFVPPERL